MFLITILKIAINDEKIGISNKLVTNHMRLLVCQKIIRFLKILLKLDF